MSLQLFDEEGRRQNLVEGGPLNEEVDLQVDATTEDPALTGDLSSDEGGEDQGPSVESESSETESSSEEDEGEAHNSGNTTPSVSSQRAPAVARGNGEARTSPPRSLLSPQATTQVDKGKRPAKSQPKAGDKRPAGSEAGTYDLPSFANREKEGAWNLPEGLERHFTLHATSYVPKKILKEEITDKYPVPSNIAKKPELDSSISKLIGDNREIDSNKVISRDTEMADIAESQ